MKVTKSKWKWIKFWGHHYLMISPNSKKHYILYHHRFFDIEEWNKYFREGKR